MSYAAVPSREPYATPYADDVVRPTLPSAAPRGAIWTSELRAWRLKARAGATLVVLLTAVEMGALSASIVASVMSGGVEGDRLDAVALAWLLVSLVCTTARVVGIHRLSAAPPRRVAGLTWWLGTMARSVSALWLAACATAFGHALGSGVRSPSIDVAYAVVRALALATCVLYAAELLAVAGRDRTAAGARVVSMAFALCAAFALVRALPIAPSAGDALGMLEASLTFGAGVAALLVARSLRSALT